MNSGEAIMAWAFCDLQSGDSTLTNAAMRNRFKLLTTVGDLMIKVTLYNEWRVFFTVSICICS